MENSMKIDYLREIRSFNRFYVDVIGLLKRDDYYNKYSLTETRVIYEISQAKTIRAADIQKFIDIDKSYLARILKKLDKDGLIKRKASETDRRSTEIILTKRGITEVEMINGKSDEQVEHMIQHLEKSDVLKLLSHMKAIKRLLSINQRDL
jgi:DNA-binding MarR family transcriptional regulator